MLCNVTITSYDAGLTVEVFTDTQQTTLSVWLCTGWAGHAWYAYWTDANDVGEPDYRQFGPYTTPSVAYNDARNALGYTQLLPDWEAAKRACNRPGGYSFEKEA